MNLPQASIILSMAFLWPDCASIAAYALMMHAPMQSVFLPSSATFQITISYRDRPIVHGIPRMLAGINYNPAEAKALPRGGGIGSCVQHSR